MAYNPPPQRDPGMTFLGLSGGILMLVIALVIVAPILCCFGMVAVGLFGAAVDPGPSISPTP